MKLRSFIALVIATLLLSTADTYAGFIMRRSAPTADSIAVSTEKAAGYSRAERRAAYSALKKMVQHEDNKGENRHRDTSGWEGIVALCCGILAVFTFGLTAIPAIIFGALGIGRHKKNQGLAIAGLVLGIVMVFVIALFILAFSLWGF